MQKRPEYQQDTISINQPTRILTVIQKNCPQTTKNSQLKTLKIKMYQKDLKLKDLVYYDKNNYTKTTIELTIVLRHCQFINLQTLELSNSHIQNCQFLKYLHCPSLNRLILENNHITNVLPLNSSFFPNLLCLNITQNPLHQISLTKVQFNDQLNIITLQSVYNFNGVQSVPNLNFLFKLNCSFIKYLEVGHMNNSIKMPKVIKKIKSKYICRDEKGQKVKQIVFS